MIPSWPERAACRDADPNLFVEPHGNESPRQSKQRIAVAQTYCARCPVTQQCSAQGKTRESGVWGGEPLDNGRLHDIARKSAPCGTEAGYQRHRNRRTVVCDGCRAAHEQQTPGRYARENKPCGTTAAYRRHLRNGEPADEACLAAERRRQHGARAARLRAADAEAS